VRSSILSTNSFGPLLKKLQIGGIKNNRFHDFAPLEPLLIREFPDYGRKLKGSSTGPKHSLCGKKLHATHAAFLC
jgi:hypothetical protein